METPRPAEDRDPPEPRRRSRGYLPHFDGALLFQFITFRLHDAVAAVIDRWKEELKWTPDLPGRDPRQTELRRRIAVYEDKGAGACYLGRADVARLLRDALQFFDGVRYRLIAWCVMPNHVHVLIETWPSYPLDRVVHSWKSYVANRANVLLGRSGTFWMREYYDRVIRNEEHFRKAVEYIHENPVKAGLVEDARDWEFSSAKMIRASQD